MSKPKTPKKTRARLEREILELHAQLAHAYHFADATLHKAGNLMASGCVVQLTAVGGADLIHPVMIKDGLSPETIEALRKDIERSYARAVEFKPKGVR